MDIESYGGLKCLFWGVTKEKRNKFNIRFIFLLASYVFHICLCVCISNSIFISSGKFMSMSTKCISFLYNPSWKFIFQNKLIDVFLYGKPEITNFLEQNNVTENLVFTMSVNIKCPLNISNCIEFLNSKSSIKKPKLPYLVLSDFCFFIYFLSLAKVR